MSITEAEETIDLTPFKVRLERHKHLATMLAAHCEKGMLEKLESAFLVGAIANIVNHGLIGHYRNIDWTRVPNEDRIRMFLPKDISPEQAVQIGGILEMRPYDILHAHVCDRLTELNALN
jgi:hypothetical protein